MKKKVNINSENEEKDEWNARKTSAESNDEINQQKKRNIIESRRASLECLGSL